MTSNCDSRKSHCGGGSISVPKQQLSCLHGAYIDLLTVTDVENIKYFMNVLPKLLRNLFSPTTFRRFTLSPAPNGTFELGILYNSRIHPETCVNCNICQQDLHEDASNNLVYELQHDTPTPTNVVCQTNNRCCQTCLLKLYHSQAKSFKGNVDQLDLYIRVKQSGGQQTIFPNVDENIRTYMDLLEHPYRCPYCKAPLRPFYFLKNIPEAIDDVMKFDAYRLRTLKMYGVMLRALNPRNHEMHVVSNNTGESNDFVTDRYVERQVIGTTRRTRTAGATATYLGDAISNTPSNIRASHRAVGTTRTEQQPVSRAPVSRATLAQDRDHYTTFRSMTGIQELSPDGNNRYYKIKKVDVLEHTYTSTIRNKPKTFKIHIPECLVHVKNGITTMLDLIADLVTLPDHNNSNVNFEHYAMTLPIHYKIVFQNNDGTIPAQIGSYYFKRASLNSIRKAYQDIQLEVDRHNLLNVIPVLRKTSILHYILCLQIGRAHV